MPSETPVDEHSRLPHPFEIEKSNYHPARLKFIALLFKHFYFKRFRHHQLPILCTVGRKILHNSFNHVRWVLKSLFSFLVFLAILIHFDWPVSIEQTDETKVFVSTANPLTLTPPTPKKLSNFRQNLNCCWYCSKVNCLRSVIESGHQFVANLCRSIID